MLAKSVAPNATTDEAFISILIFGFIAGTLAIIIYVLAAGDRAHKKAVTTVLVYVALIRFRHETDFLYASKDVLLLHKSVAAAILTLFVISFLFIVCKYFWFVLKRALKLEPWAVSLTLWVTTLLASQLCGRLNIKIPGPGRVLEKSLELWAAIYALVAALTWQRLWKNNVVQRSAESH